MPCTLGQFEFHFSIIPPFLLFAVDRCPRWKIDALPALAVMEWTSVVELGRPMRTLKVERSGNLGDCRKWGKSVTGVFPVDF